MMSVPWVRKTLAFACLAWFCLSSAGPAAEQIAAGGHRVETVRYRPFSRLFGDKDESPESKSKEDDKSSTAPAMQEPLAAPPTTRRLTPKPTASNSSTDEADPLLQLVERAIEKTSSRYLDANQHRPWQIMHGLVALRNDFVLRDGRRAVNAIEWISNGAKLRDQYWFEATEYGGRAHPYNGVPYEFEGHVNQTLALLALSNLPLSHEFSVEKGRKVTMADMVRHAQMTVNDKEEITWTLWFLTHYLDIDSEWTNAAGEPWSLEELVRVQTEAKVVGAPCGGTHGLFAIAYARNSYLHKHGQLRGVWFQADQKVQQYIERSRALQNYDGSFSTEFFKGPGHSRDFNERIKASGHMLEWLMMSLPHKRLSEAWVRRAIASVATDLVHNADRPAECGPLYHALHSLVLYRDRVKPAEPVVPETLVQQPQQPAEHVAEAPPVIEPQPQPATIEPTLVEAKTPETPLGESGNSQIVIKSRTSLGTKTAALPVENAEPEEEAAAILTPVEEGPSLEPIQIAIEPEDGPQLQ